MLLWLVRLDGVVIANQKSFIDDEDLVPDTEQEIDEALQPYFEDFFKAMMLMHLRHESPRQHMIFYHYLEMSNEEITNLLKQRLSLPFIFYSLFPIINLSEVSDKLFKTHVEHTAAKHLSFARLPINCDFFVFETSQDILDKVQTTTFRPWEGINTSEQNVTRLLSEVAQMLYLDKPSPKKAFKRQHTWNKEFRP